tara:strand:- start:204 stop:479 length:276 start_codon:yes stop_codon:yes gene_type:complete
MSNKEKESLIKEITKSISETNLDIYETIEVLANIFIMQGSTYMEINKNISNKVELANLVVQDIKENGETLPNSLVRQGLIILSWLKSKENI